MSNQTGMGHEISLRFIAVIAYNYDEVNKNCSCAVLSKSLLGHLKLLQ